MGGTKDIATKVQKEEYEETDRWMTQNIGENHSVQSDLKVSTLDANMQSTTKYWQKKRKHTAAGGAF